jgi:hypothetical protein
VLVGFLMHPPTPLASRPNSFAEERLHASRYLVPLVGNNSAAFQCPHP